MLLYEKYSRFSVKTTNLNKIELCFQTTLPSYSCRSSSHIQSQHEGKMTVRKSWDWLQAGEGWSVGYSTTESREGTKEKRGGKGRNYRKEGGSVANSVALALTVSICFWFSLPQDTAVRVSQSTEVVATGVHLLCSFGKKEACNKARPANIFKVDY